jgi:serine O-acetyltransferase
MNKAFYDHIYQLQQSTEAVPPNEVIAVWVSDLFCTIFPERATCKHNTAKDVEAQFARLEKQLVNIMHATRACGNCDSTEKARQFFNHIPELYRVLNTDLDAILEGDPAARSRFEIIRAYPGFYAIFFYRVAHQLVLLEIPLLPRIITEWAHSKTGIDIHPGAVIGEHFFIDHGTGIVIGETCHIGDHVKLYQGVTLGALSISKDMAFTKRHPTVEDHVIIYSGATILGGDTVIGEHSIIGGNVWLTKSIPPYSTVYHRPDIEVVEQIK